MILLIDDDAGLSEVIELLLVREGYAVRRAGTVKAGLECMHGAEIDLVITDLKLPDGTGLNVIAAIRAARPTLPIIMITSYSSIESAVGALRAGAVDYVTKPFDNDEFLHAVARALSDRRMKRERGRPLAIEEHIREVIESFQDTHSETEIARMLGIGRKALWMRRRQWGLKRAAKNGT